MARCVSAGRQGSRPREAWRLGRPRAATQAGHFTGERHGGATTQEAARAGSNLQVCNADATKLLSALSVDRLVWILACSQTQLKVK